MTEPEEPTNRPEHERWAPRPVAGSDPVAAARDAAVARDAAELDESTVMRAPQPPAPAAPAVPPAPAPPAAPITPSPVDTDGGGGDGDRDRDDDVDERTVLRPPRQTSEATDISLPIFVAPKPGEKPHLTPFPGLPPATVPVPVPVPAALPATAALPAPPPAPAAPTETAPVPLTSPVPVFDITDEALDPSAGAAGSDEPPSRSRGAAVVSARILTGVIGMAVAAATIAAAVFLPLPSHVVSRAAVVVSPAASAQQRVCAGPLLTLGDASGAGATALSSLGQPTVTRGQSAGTATLSSLKTTDNVSGDAPRVITLPASTATPAPLVSGAQAQTASTATILGLATAECREAESDGWLSGGSTTTGRTTLLSLANPSTVAATVDLSIYSETGLVSAAGTRGIVVEPGAQRVFSLAAFAPGIASPVVHVQSRGGKVVASLQQSTIRTLEPGGVDFVSTTALPATKTTIVGLVIQNSIAVTSRGAEEGFADLGTVLRLFAPGDAASSASITLRAEGSTGAGTTVKVGLVPGIVSDVPLSSFDDGNYTVTIVSSAPLVASARVSAVGSTGAADFAWIEASRPLVRHALVSIATSADVSATLHLANTTAASEKVTVRTGATTVAQLTVPAGETVALSVAPSARPYLLEGFTSLVASATFTGDGTNSAFTITPPDAESGSLTVHP